MSLCHCKSKTIAKKIKDEEIIMVKEIKITIKVITKIKFLY